MQLLVRNKIADLSTWHSYFDGDRSLVAEVGVTLQHLWQTTDDPNDVFFLLDIKDIDSANAFMAKPESQELGVKSGVISREVHHLETLPIPS